jgi:hypothetical protein
MKIERILPKAGVTIDRTFAGKQYRLKVADSPDGLVYELNGRIYKTPTAAAKSITKFEVNGWRFWHMKKE